MKNYRVAFVHNLQRSKSLEEAEFDTPQVVEAIQQALEAGPYQVIPIEMTKDGTWITQLQNSKPDIIINTAEGFKGVGRESLAPICFEQLNFRYVGSGPYQCFLTLDKYLTKQVVASAGVPVAEGTYCTQLEEVMRIAPELSYPVFAKPNFEGSSKGITQKSLCRNPQELIDHCREELLKFSEGMIIERYIDGKDITVPYVAGLGDDGVLDAVEYYLSSTDHLTPSLISNGPEPGKSWIYDYDLKNNDDNSVNVRCPAQLSAETAAAIKKAMKKAVRALSIEDMARADFRVTANGEIYFLEINALPSLQPGAGLFAAAARYGLSYQQTLQHIVSHSIERHKLQPSTSKTIQRLRSRKPNVALVFNLKRKNVGEDGYEAESEFDSISTVEAIADGIRKAGYPTTLVEVTRNLPTELQKCEADIVFNIAEGSSQRTREAQVPAVCDLLGIEHTGSDATCLAVTLDKSMTNRLLRSEGIQVPRSALLLRPADLAKKDLNFFPIIAKPNLEGTSKGIFENSVARDMPELKTILDRLWPQAPGGILCEEYIIGREMTVGVLGNQSLKILGPSELIFKNRNNPYPVYSFLAKQASNPRDNEFFKLDCPAQLSDHLRKRIHHFAKRCFRATGSRDVARIDFKVNAAEDIYFIEINPLPGLAPGFSDLCLLAESAGMNHHDLVAAILRPAVYRWRKHQPRRNPRT